MDLWAVSGLNILGFFNQYLEYKRLLFLNLFMEFRSRFLFDNSNTIVFLKLVYLIHALLPVY